MSIDSLVANPSIKRLSCSFSGQDVKTDFSRPLGLCSCCPAPGKPVLVEYDTDRVLSELQGREPYRPAGGGLWGYSALLPVIGPPRGYAADVGLTPTFQHDSLGAELGVELFLKDEGLNPSGSFKARGLSVAVALGRACGAQRFCLPTQGNAGVAASLFSARVGLPGCLVYMPEGYQDGIYHREARFFGAEVRFRGANIAAAGRAMREDLAEQLSTGEFVDLSTFFEPGRLEGKKTMGLEIVDHFGPRKLPDFILYPTGGGTGLVGIWKAFAELQTLGVSFGDPPLLPRMVAVQSERCAPVVRSFERGLIEVEPLTSLGTVADGLDVPGAIMGHEILRVLRESQGEGVAVSEREIVEAFTALGKQGVGTGFESAALLAALARLRKNAIVGEGSRVLLLLTASHLIPLGKKSLPS